MERGTETKEGRKTEEIGVRKVKTEEAMGQRDTGKENQGSRREKWERETHRKKGEGSSCLYSEFISS